MIALVTVLLVDLPNPQGTSHERSQTLSIPS